MDVEEISCPICCEIFKAPVLLSCSHSFCKKCLQQFWTTKRTKECPICRRRSSRDDPPCNLVLQNLCESYLKTWGNKRRHSSESEEVCSLHDEKLKLFCLEDKQPEELKSLQEKLKHREKFKEECVKTLKHIQSQVEHTEHQIKLEFEKLHQFLRDEEEIAITALRKEQEQKNQIMQETFAEINGQISAFSHTIRDLEKMMNGSEVSFLKNFPDTMKRVQSIQSDPQLASGALINVAQYLGNLPFRAWKKMQDIVQNTPVVLDPNTAHPELLLSDDLTSLTCSKNKQLLPANPERFDEHCCVLGSEGFNSGTHSWDVDVKESSSWSLGITVASNQRKGYDFFDRGVWSVQNKLYEEAGFPVVQKLERVRVHLDYDRGTVSFSDPVTNTKLYTFTTTFTETVFPFFYSFSHLRIV